MTRRTSLRSNRGCAARSPRRRLSSFALPPVAGPIAELSGILDTNPECWNRPNETRRKDADEAARRDDGPGHGCGGCRRIAQRAPRAGDLRVPAAARCTDHDRRDRERAADPEIDRL